ncbi:trifunctional serine/threonine-protein kinase/ATP-binding protein/sensor histidine kinase [Hyalangium versicolor]|uniref:trifunctional serine/threonine-protein kinase/ATP-binding protein/sensor histidine kinase n=1 Tax=Hyalangium versicolor TaxID=2861190 RepID=UPI001CCE740B|nr:trifunctional serine/threonine-protein kinase/ATP-binding protein/sensor histidine kinase [Hyalangium versicolor]
MQAIPGYRIEEKLHQSSGSVLHRAYSEREGRFVLLKTPVAAYPLPAELAGLEREHEIGRMLEAEGIVRHLELVPHGRSCTLVLEDFGASSLSDYLATQGPLEVGRFLNVAQALTRAVESLHRHQIIHKDICPANVFYNPRSGQVKLGNLGLASVLSRDRQEFRNPALIEGTLAYISPEQTGRMNRAIDHRADLYALGATFYHLLVGAPPFEAQEAVELISCHIARPPQPPHLRRSSIPEPLSAILCKLLEKNAEDRYQSAAGLLADLSECARQWEATSQIVPFTLGEQDVRRTLNISEKLYGREEALATLMAAFERATSGQVELLLVSGPAGVGKSAVVREIHKRTSAQRGYFASGKCDQIGQTPLSIFIQVVAELARQLLTESEARLEQWRAVLRDAVRGNGELLIEWVPELVHVLPEQAPPPALPSGEARRRFETTLTHFLLAFASAKHPLILFLDDLQWIEPASLSFLTQLATNPSASHLLIITACRDDEVLPTAPLAQVLTALAQRSPRHAQLRLAPLQLEHVAAMVADTLNCEEDTGLHLAELILEKTGGNPFFITQLFDTLHQEGLLRFDAHDRRWTWSLSRIQRLGVSDNVVDLMVKKILRYPEETQRALMLASNLGSTFDLGSVSLILDAPIRSVAQWLWEPARDGLLLLHDHRPPYSLWAREERKDAPQSAQVLYRFAHLRVQEAARSQIPPDQQEALSLRIGQRLIEHLTPEQQSERIFELVKHFNLGSGRMASAEERATCARLNLMAAQRAKAATGYRAAIGYLQQGIRLLSEEAWDGHFELMFALHRELLECEFLGGHLERAEALFALTARRARTPEHVGDIYPLMCRTFQTAARAQEGFQLGREGLRLLGVELPTEPDATWAQLEARAEELQRLMAGRDPQEFVELPVMQDGGKARCLALLHETWTCALMMGEVVPAYLTALHMTALSLKHGNSEYSACGYVAYGMVLAMKGDYARAYAFGQLARTVSQRFKHPLVISKVNNTFANFINPFFNPLGSNIPLYEESFQHALKSGDRWWGAWATVWIWVVKFLKGSPLSEVHATGERYQDYVRSSGYVPLQETLRVMQHLVLQLQGSTEREGSEPEEFQEEAVVHRLSRLRAEFAIPWYYQLLSLSLYLQGDFEEALRTNDEADKRRELIQKTMHYSSHCLYRALILAARCAKTGSGERQERHREIASHREQLREWAEQCPVNYRHEFLLVSAEHARLTGDSDQASRLYEEALVSARETGHLHHEAIAHELAGKHYLELSRPKAARGYLQEAHLLYSRWGAATKAASLEANHPEIFGTSQSQAPARAVGDSSRLQAERIDLATVMKAAQALSGEIVLGRLMERIVRIGMENAGARRGMLILEREGRLLVEATVSLEADTVQVQQSAPLERYPEVPRSVIQFVHRTGKTVVLDDAMNDASFRADPDIASRRVRSVLCLPAVGQAWRRGVLYLENNLTVGAFTPERAHTLQLLSTQAAISLENAVLYETLEQRVQARTYELTEKNETLAATLHELRETQDQLITQSRLAALGSLTAGIAHEIRNPLNFIHNFSEHTMELCDELLGDLPRLAPGLEPGRAEALQEIGTSMKASLAKVVEHGARASRIIGSMLQHARGISSERTETDLNLLLRESAALAQQAAQASDPAFRVTIHTELDESLGLMKVSQQEVGQVLLNLLNNACFAVHAKRKAKAGQGYVPEILLKSRGLGSAVELRIRDNGTGIPAAVRNRIFEPFFTTKPAGEGTGLGLSLSREIIEQGNKGTLRLETQEGEFAEFILTLPRGTQP